MARSFACNTQITQSILRVRDRFCLLHTSYLSLEMIFVLADPVFCISHAQLPKWCCSCEIPHMQIRFCSWKGRCCCFFLCAKRYTTRRRCAADTAAERSCAREWPGVPHDKRSSLYKFRCFARYLPSPNNTARQKSVVLHFDFNEPLQWWWPCIEQIFVVLFLWVFHV